jgi:hypothetical protein
VKNGITRRDFGAGTVALSLAGAAGAAPSREGKRPWPYLIGADISWVPQQESQGAIFFENGEQRDVLAILRDAGFNAIKLRLFVSPENGYSRRGSGPAGPWGGTASSIAFARRIKAAGFHLSVTLHYSDTWADPQHQDKPAAWAKLPFPQLVDAVHAYTSDTLAAFKAAGVSPDLVLLGNETTFGMLWPDGRVPLTIPTGNPDTDKVHMNVPGAGGFDNFAALLKAGIAAARKQLPGVPLAIHNHLGRHWPIVQNWTDNLLRRGVRFDAVGFSCYQQAAEGDWARTFAEFSKHYPRTGFFAAEYSSRKRYLNDLVHSYPNGWGSFIWEPTTHQEAIFSRDGVNAGGGPKPNLLSQGRNGAEAPGSAPVPTAPAVAPPPLRRGFGGRYDAIPEFLQLYRDMARDYRLKSLRG